MNSISLKAYAKINLGLDVLGTLPDGYHEVKMVMQSISLYDKVNIKKMTQAQSMSKPIFHIFLSTEIIWYIRQHTL